MGVCVGEQLGQLGCDFRAKIAMRTSGPNAAKPISFELFLKPVRDDHFPKLRLLYFCHLRSLTNGERLAHKVLTGNLV